MNLLFRLMLIISIPFTGFAKPAANKPVWFAEGEMKVVEQVSDLLTKTKMTSALLKHEVVASDKSFVDFLSKKLGGKDHPFEVKKTAPGAFKIFAGPQSVDFAIKNVREGIFEVNKKTFKYDSQKTHEENWNKITGLMPVALNDSPALPDLFIPKANAVLPFAVVYGIQVTVAAVGAFAVYAGLKSTTCYLIKDDVNRCMSLGERYEGICDHPNAPKFMQGFDTMSLLMCEAAKEAAPGASFAVPEMMNRWYAFTEEGTTLSCDAQTKELQKCMRSYVNKYPSIGRRVDKRTAAFLGVKYVGEQDPRKPVAPKTDAAK